MYVKHFNESTLIIFTDAATSAKALVSIGVFLCLDEFHINRYANISLENLSTEVAAMAIFKEYTTKKSTWAEIKTVIDALSDVLNKSGPGHKVAIYTDCKSLCDLINRRKAKLKKANFVTRKGKIHQNAELYQELFAITDKFQIKTFKVKGHDLHTCRLTLHEKIFAILDKLCRKKLRSILRDFS